MCNPGWLLLILLILSGSVRAETVELSQAREFFLKTSGQMFSTREALNPQLAVPETTQRIPLTRLHRRDTTYWVQFNLINHSRETRWTLDTGNIIAARLTAHVQTGERQQILEQGFRVLWPFDLRYGMTLDLPANSLTRIWICVESPLGATHPVFSILPATDYQAKTFSYNTQLLIAIGALLILALYQILVFIPTRDWTWFWCALVQISGALAWAAQAKILLYGVALPAHPALLYLPLFAAGASALQFARCYLKLQRSHWPGRLLDGTALLVFLGGLGGLLLPANYYTLVLQAALTVTLILLVTITLWRAHNGFTGTRFLLAGGSILLLAAFCHRLDQVLHLQIIENDILLGTRAQVLAMFAFMLGLVERANLVRRERPQQDTRAATDPLTQLPNRTAFERDVRAWEAYCKEGILKDFYLTFFEVTTLRQTNANRGTREGDRLLLLIGQWLQEQTGNHNVYRIGGDEFVVLTQKSVNWDLAPLQRLLQQEGFRDCTINLGCSCLSESTGRSSLLKLADDRLHGIAAE